MVQEKWAVNSWPRLGCCMKIACTVLSVWRETRHFILDMGPLAGSCGHGNEPFVSMKGREFVD